MRKGSKSYSYVLKAREAMIAAVEIFNSPSITFKTETCVTLACTAWTYLLQGYCLEHGVEIRARDTTSKRRRYLKTEGGEYKTLPLKEMIELCPSIIDEPTKMNLLFLIEIRNRVQHYAECEIDALVAPKIQANILTFKKALGRVTNGAFDIASSLPYALQFSELSLEQTKNLLTSRKISNSLRTFILDFEASLTPEQRQSANYQAHVKLEVVNKSRGDDLQYVEVLGIGSTAPTGITPTYLKEVEKQKYRPSDVVKKMQEEGYADFSITVHTNLWKDKDGKNSKHSYGTTIAGTWYWYEKWVNEVVRPFCISHYPSSTKRPSDA